MIKCKNCEYVSDYTGRPCPICGAKSVISESDIELSRRELAAAVTEKLAAVEGVYRVRVI